MASATISEHVTSTRTSRRSCAPPDGRYPGQPGKRHTTKTIGDRYRLARDVAARQAADGRAPQLAGIAGIQLRDCRDTCVIRLWHSKEVKTLEHIPPWTGHSVKSAVYILRQHYLCLLEEGAIETARDLARWAGTHGFEA